MSPLKMINVFQDMIEVSRPAIFMIIRTAEAQKLLYVRKTV